MKSGLSIPLVDKQKMYYSNYVGEQDNYIEWTDEAGEIHKIEAGTTEPFYTEPVKFKASISGELSELHLRAYGVDQSSCYSEITCLKNRLPLIIGTLIWKETEIGYKEDGTPDEKTADYIVKGMLKEYLHEDYFLLQRTNNAQIGGDDNA